MSTPVHIWPDGTYCAEGELEEMLSTGVSDDYETIEVPYDEDIDTFVMNHIGDEEDKRSLDEERADNED